MKKILIALFTFLLVPSLVSAATLSISPSSQSVKTGDEFIASVNLDTQGVSVTGVDLRYINFDPKLVKVQDSSTSTEGVQIEPGSLMSATLANSVDNDLGRITFSQVALPVGEKYNSSGILANITFKALKSGTVNLTFDYTPLNTTDTNVAASGTDVLTKVTNSSITINSQISLWQRILKFLGFEI
jgi:hypothetical protein